MSGEKTEDPTPKKRREARKQGQIPRSQELVSWAAVLAATFLAGLALDHGARLFEDLAHDGAELMARPALGEAQAYLGRALMGVLGVVLPLAAGMAALGVVGNVAQVGWAPTGKALTPQLKKINPVSGLKRLFSPQTAWEGAKTALKVGILAGVAWGPLVGTTEALATSGKLAVPSVAAAVGAAALGLVRKVALAGLVLAAVDYLLTRRRIMKSLRMTKQEVKDEAKQSEGSPELKSEIRARALRMSRNRMITAVADADVVVVNPTHVAVALKYVAGTGAPKVVAKGAGTVADRIREEAKAHGVPLVGDVPLARTLHRLCEVGDEIPGDLYEAVARVLAFVFALRARPPGIASASGVHHLPG